MENERYIYSDFLFGSQVVTRKVKDPTDPPPPPPNPPIPPPKKKRD